MYRWFADDYRYAIDAGRYYEEGDVQKAVRTLLQPVQDGEMTMEQAVNGLLVASSGSNTGAVFAEAGRIWTDRLFPHISSASVKEEHASMHAKSEDRKELMEKLAAAIHILERKGSFTVRDGEILFNGKPADLAEMAPDVTAQLDFFDPGDLSLCVVEVSIADTEGLKPLSRIADSEDSFAAKVYTDRVYPVGLVFRAKDGTHVAAFQVYYAVQFSHIREIRFYRIPDAMWEKMDTPGKVGVVEEK